MATVYSEVKGFDGGSKGYRSKLVVSTTSYSDRVEISWTATVQMRYAYLYGVGISCEGKTGTGYLSSNPGSTWTNVKTISGTTTVYRTSSSQDETITAKAYGTTVSGYGGAGSSSTSVSYTVTVNPLETYAVKYNANGGSGAPSSQTKTYGTTLKLSTTKPTRSGHAFKNWNTKKDGSGTSYSSGGNYTANAAATLYAQWTANTYTIVYNANGGAGAPSEQTKTYGKSLTLSQTIPTRDNYEFAGWATSETNASNGVVTYQAGDTYTVNSNAKLYAVWVLAYKPPIMSEVSLTRCNEDGSASAIGKYVMVGFQYAIDSLLVDSFAVNVDINGVSAEGSAGGNVAAISDDTAGETVFNSFSGVYGGEISPIQDYNITVTVDTAGLTTSAFSVLEAEEYKRLVIDGGVATRTDENKNEDDDGTCGLITFNWSFDEMGGANSISNMRVEYRELNGSGDYTMISSDNTIVDNIVSQDGITSGSCVAFEIDKFNTDKSYEVIITLEDQVSTLTKKLHIYNSFYTVDFKDGGTGIAFGRASVDDNFDVDMDANFRKDVVINGRKYGENQILWSGEDDGEEPKFMGEGSGVAFNHGRSDDNLHKVSEQPNGIVLVFSYFNNEDDVAENASFSCHFVPKSMIGQNGLGKQGSHTFIMSTFTSQIDIFGIKHLYVSDTRIDGYVRNGSTYTSDCGIKYSNNKYALRYVIGV